MIIHDRIFGSHTIVSPTIIELIKSEPLQRLKRIGQAGQPEATDPRPYRFSRYDHSIGVMLLLKILGATEEEQIAGLLHDVSHTAFSHTIDLVLDKGASEDFQDSQHEHFITNSDIPEILKRYGFDPKRIYDYHHFTLLEQDLPDLCADRVDYSLRESPKKLIDACLPALKGYKGRIVFTDKESAKIFATQYMWLQQNSWGGRDHNIRANIFAKALKQAMQKKIITLDDFWADDAHVLKKLQQSKDPFIKASFKMLEMKSYAGLSGKQTIRKKFRHIDPEVLARNQLIKLSELDPAYKIELNEARRENEKGINVPDIF